MVRMCQECGRPIRRRGYAAPCRDDRSKKKHRRGHAVACLHWYSKPANSMSGLRLRAVMPTTVDGGSTRRDRSGMLVPRERAGMRRTRSAPMPTGLRGCWDTGSSWLSSRLTPRCVVTISCHYRLSVSVVDTRSAVGLLDVGCAGFSPSMSHTSGFSFSEFLRIFTS